MKNKTQTKINYFKYRSELRNNNIEHEKHNEKLDIYFEIRKRLLLTFY